jgi:hypothetical protein
VKGLVEMVLPLHKLPPYKNLFSSVLLEEHMIASIRTAFVFVLVIAGLLVPAPTIAQSSDTSRQALDSWLSNIQGATSLPQVDWGSPQVESVTDKSVNRLFPSYHLYSIRFRMYPVASMAPSPLKSSNLAAVSSGNSVTLLTDKKELESFFQSAAPTTDAARARSAMRAWLALLVQLRQDGFFQFSIADDAINANTSSQGIVVSGKAIATKGGVGDITATLEFDADGRLTNADATENIKPGVRPICQATKLLDKDPIVRRMAEQGILVMGGAAGSYLTEQRKLASPALQKEIDRVWERILSEGW